MQRDKKKIVKRVQTFLIAAAMLITNMNFPILSAKAEGNEVTVTFTFDANGGQFSDGSQQKVVTRTVNPDEDSYVYIELSETPVAPTGKTWTFMNWNDTGDMYGTTYYLPYMVNTTGGDVNITAYAYWNKTQTVTVPRTYVYVRGLESSYSYSYSCNDTITLDDESNITNWGYGGLDSLDLASTTSRELGVTYSMRSGSNIYYSDEQLTTPITDADKYPNCISTIYVDCRVDKYLRTYDISNNVTGTYSFLAGERTPVPSEPTVPDGYSFVGWYSMNEIYTGDTSNIDLYIEYVNDNLSPFDFDTVKLDGTVYYNIRPQFQKNTPTQVAIDFYDSDGQFLIRENVETTATLNSFKPSNPTKENKFFLGWSTDGTEANIVSNATTFSTNTTLTAVYVDNHKVTYTLYNDDGSTFPDGTTDPKTYSYETYIQGQNNVVREALVSYKDMTPVIPTREGYIFCGWTTTLGQNYGDVYSDTSSYDSSGFEITCHTGTSFWQNYYNNSDNTVMTIYDSITVYPVWTKAITFDACGGTFSDNSSSTYSTHEMLYDTYTNTSGNRQQTLWQDKCPVPTREGWEFVGWSDTAPISYDDFSNLIIISDERPRSLETTYVSININFANVESHSAAAPKSTNDAGVTVYAVYVPAYLTITYHMDDMELDGTIQDNGISGVTDYIDNSNPDDIKLIQYVRWHQTIDYTYSFKKTGRDVSNIWYLSRNFDNVDDYVGTEIPALVENIELYTRQYVDILFDYNGYYFTGFDSISHEQYELGEYLTSHTDGSANLIPNTPYNGYVYLVEYNEETYNWDTYYYIFGGWYTTPDCVGDPVDFAGLTADVQTKYYAKWIEPTITHTVTFEDNIDGQTIDTKSVNHNSTVSAPAYTGSSLASSMNLIMVGYSENGSVNNLFDFSTPITSNITLYATYNDAVTVTFYDGTIIDEQTIAKNTCATDPNYSGDGSGRTFLGWSETGSADDLFNLSTPVSTDLFLIAVYSENGNTGDDSFTVTFYANNGTFSNNNESYQITTLADENGNQYISLSDSVVNPTREGYEFLGYSCGADDELVIIGIGASGTMIIGQDTEFYAVWKPMCKVIFNSNGGSSVQSQWISNGSRAIRPENPTREGYTFDCWTFGLLEYNFNSPVTQNITLVAQWTVNTTPVNYNVTLDANGGKFTSNNQETKIQDVTVDELGYISSDVVEWEVPVRTGYRFNGWQKYRGDDGFTQGYPNQQYTDDLVFYATWFCTHTVTFKDYDGTVLKTEQVNDGGSATAPANPTREGYTFTGWSCSFTNVTSDLEVTAQYTQNTPTNPEPEPSEPEPEPSEPEPEPSEPEPEPSNPDPEPSEPEPEPSEPEDTTPLDDEPTDSEDDDIIEDDIIPEIIVNEITPEDDPEPIYTGNEDTDRDTRATAFGRFVEVVKTAVIKIVISLGAILGLLGLLLLILLWMKRIKVLNNKATDEYSDENFEVVYRTSVRTEGNLISELQRQEKRVWTITIPDEIFNERVTDDFRIELKKLFCKRYHGEKLIIKLGDSEDAKQIAKEIDEQEPVVEFKFTE